MKWFLTTSLCVLFTACITAQNYFNIVPDFGGNNNEGMTFNVIPLEDEIKIIGLVHDSVVPGFQGGSWPILGTVSYHGEYLNTVYLVDSLYERSFTYRTRRLVFKNDSICYLYDRRHFTGERYYNAYLIELNYRNDRILRSKVVYNELTESDYFARAGVALGKNGKLYLINTNSKDGILTQILTILDEELNLESQTIIPMNGRINRPQYLEIDNDGNLIIVGISLGEKLDVYYESGLYRQVIDSNLTLVSFQLAESDINHTLVVDDAFTVIKSKSGHWVAGTYEVRKTYDCHNCSIWIPYVLAVAEDFSETLWETRMFDGDVNKSRPAFEVKSLTEVEDGYIFTGVRSDYGGLGNSGLLGKVGLNGDSLWLRYYNPVGWDSLRTGWIHWNDIKTTAQGNIVVGGHTADWVHDKIVPWILHLDKDGCLVPGCLTTSIDGPPDDQEMRLLVYPNPTATHCHIHVRDMNYSSSGYMLRIINDVGAEVFTSVLNHRDMVYMVDVQNWPVGLYIVHVSADTGKQWTRKFVVVK